MTDINVFDWMEATRLNKAGITRAEKAYLKTIREYVFKKAGTSANAIVVAKSRGSIGRELYESVHNATVDLKREDLRINVSFDDYLKWAEKERELREAMKSIEQAARR